MTVPATLWPQRGQTMLAGCMAAAPIDYWAAALCAGRLWVDTAEPLRHVKGSHNRYCVLGPGGKELLSVPLAAAPPHTPLHALRLSEHANWRARHWGALYSNYGRTPYFDFVADDLHAIIVDGKQTHLLDYCRQLNDLILDFLALPIAVEYAPVADDEALSAAADLRPRWSAHSHAAGAVGVPPYHQLWSERHGGFTPGLSILDLLMNTGREAIFTLRHTTP